MPALAHGVGWVQSLPVPAMVGLCLAAALVSGGLLLRAARTGAPECRSAWLGVALTCVLWNAGHIALLLGMPEEINYGLFRTVELATLTWGIGTFPGVFTRPWWDWLVILVDGWMTVGGVAVVAWLVLRNADLATIYGVPPHLDPWLLTWVGLDLAVMSVLAGLLARAPARDRRVVVYVLVAGLVATFGDLTSGLSGQLRPDLLIWVLATVMLGCTQIVGGRDAFRSTFVSAEGPGGRIIRIGQLPVVPALFFLFAPEHHDVVAQVAAAGVLGACFANITVHSQANTRLLVTLSGQRHQLAALLRDSRDALIQTDDRGVIEFANAAAGSVLGRRVDELVGFPSGELIHPDDRDWVTRECFRLSEPDGPVSTQLEYRLRYGEEGEYRWFESTISFRQDKPGWVLASRDVTTRVELREELAHQARTDPLTGLLNRSALLAAVGARAAGPDPLTVLFVDLDGFKAVNDALGHAAGDRLLQEVADRLRAVTGPGDVVARLGGDEFAVLVDAADRTDALVERLLEVVAGLNSPDRPGIQLGASIGVATAQGRSAQELLRDADLAMYRAKAAGGTRAVRFEPWMHEGVLERTRLRDRLEVAIRTDGLLLAHQPVIELATGRWHGFEALVRWQDGETRRQPDEFVPLAEESGLIHGLGRWVLERAVREISGSLPGANLTIAVNVSPQQLEDDGFTRDVLALMDRLGVDPGRLALEITEQTAVQDLGRAASRLGPLRAEGVHVAIDDFGTGFSSMRYLTQLPVDALKIDRQFVDGLGVRRDDEVLVFSMLRLAADLGLDVVAEGVETAEQADILRAGGCTLAQGFYYSRPVPVDELRRLWLAGDAVPAPRATSSAGSRPPEPVS